MFELLEKKMNFNELQFASCWEDADLLLQHLALEPNDKVVSVASGGDNSFSLLVTDNVVVNAVDINPVQIHICEIKKHAIKVLSYEVYLEFIGLHKAANRWKMFEQFANALPDETMNWALKHKRLIASGIMNQGKFEKYFKVFRKFIMPFVHSKKTIRRLFEPKSHEEQKKFYKETFNTKRWRYVVNKFLSEEKLGSFEDKSNSLSKDKEAFSYYFSHRIKEHFSSLLCQQNYFLHYIFFGYYKEELPHYLRKDNFERIKMNIDSEEFREET
jgi:S-adenosylmethionine-diacylglycerol 3-amino-3-carboxypropyl transferase